MVAIDWFGCSLTIAFMTAILHGRHQVARAVLAVLLGEVGRTCTVYLLGGTLVGLVIGGAFTHARIIGVPPILIQVGGVWAGAGLARLLGRQFGGDALRYAMCLSGFVLLFYR